MDHPIRCACGTVAGAVTLTHRMRRAICYCRDCQSYAHALGNADAILDADGGSDVVPTVQEAVRFQQGHDAIACLSLTREGLLRWYARCCNTPLGNTARDRRLSYVGLLHSCLERSPGDLDAVFGPPKVRVNTHWAKRKVSATSLAALALMATLAPRIVMARVRGSFRQSPFFDSAGEPIARVRVLDAAELERARGRVHSETRQ